MKNMIVRMLLLPLVVVAFNVKAQTFTYDFQSGYDSWSGDFADYPVTDSVFYELEFTRTNMPSPLDASQYGLKITGNNHSDDLFMFMKRKIDGLLPNTSYLLYVNVEFASCAPTNAVGVGGSPGESVGMKAGSSLVEPKKIVSSDYYRMNIDKNNQGEPGADMDTIGHIGVSDTTTVFALISRNNYSHPFAITTDGTGEVWVCIGTESGFEATTTLYYKQITLEFSSYNSVGNPKSSHFFAYPNPANGILNIETNDINGNKKFSIKDQLGRTVLQGALTETISRLDISKLRRGIYFIVFEDESNSTYKFVAE